MPCSAVLDTRMFAHAQLALDFDHVQESGRMLQQRLQKQLQKLSTKEAKLVTRMCGHHLNLTAIAEMLHMCVPRLHASPAAKTPFIF